MLGYVVLTGIVAAGVGTVVTHTPTVLNVLTFVGAAYSGQPWLGDALRPRHCAGLPASVPRGGRRGWMLRGMEVSGLNPKGLLLLAMLPQLTHPRGT